MAALQDNVHQSWFGPVRQIAYVVRDLDASVRHWLRHTGIGPWTCFRNAVLEGRFLGQPVTVAIDVALGYQGELEIELIQPRGSGTPYHDDAGRPLVGMHHIASFTDDLERAVAMARERGLAPRFEATNPVTRVAYLESPDEPGVLFELIQYSAEGLAGWRQRVEAARTWDGSDPIRTIDL